MSTSTELRPGLRVRVLPKADMGFETSGTIEKVGDGFLGPWTVIVRPDEPTKARILDHTGLNPERVLAFTPGELAVVS